MIRTSTNPTLTKVQTADPLRLRSGQAFDSVAAATFAQDDSEGGAPTTSQHPSKGSEGSGWNSKVLFAGSGLLNRGEDCGAGDHCDAGQNDHEGEHEARCFRARSAWRGRNWGIITPGWKKWKVFFVDIRHSRYFCNEKRIRVPKADADARSPGKGIGAMTIHDRAGIGSGRRVQRVSGAVERLS